MLFCSNIVDTCQHYKINRADYSYCSIQDCVQLHVIENQTKNHVHTRRVWFVCLFNTSSSSETGCPGLVRQPKDFVWDSAFYSVILHILYLAPLVCLQCCTEFQARIRKKKKKKDNGHISAKSSPFNRNFLKAPLIAIMYVISQCSDSSNHKGSISCKFLSEHVVILNSQEPFRSEERKNEHCID